MGTKTRWFPCLMLAALPAVMASCSASGKPLPGAPTAVLQELTQGVILTNICKQQTSDASVNQCGDFYSTYPTGFVVDAATDIFDKNGVRIDSCGGNRFYVSEQAREEAERKCATYLVGCKPVVASCKAYLQGR